MTPPPGLAFGQAGLSTARGEADRFIRLKCYDFSYFLDSCLRGNDTPQMALLFWSRSLPPGEGRVVSFG